MSLPAPDVVVYVCSNCVPAAARLPRQWAEQDARVVVREVPCSGKMDAQYLLHGIEGGVRGLCVVRCPKGECHLAQGNYRAEVRLHTLQRILSEIGLEPERAELITCSPQLPPDEFQREIRDAARRIASLGVNPLRSAGACAPSANGL
jgi:F420-non-reducing hydrogenase iron-sulfur subunit